MKISIKSFFVIVLMSMMTSVVSAQTPTTKYNVAKLSTEEVTRVKRLLASNHSICPEDSAMAAVLLEHNNTPEEGVIEEDEEIFSATLVNDNWIAFISYQRGSYWLSFVVTRKGKFVGRLDVMIG